MYSFLLFSRLSLLRCCNNYLILIYDQLSETDEQTKTICIERSGKRKKLRSEIEGSLCKIRNEKELLAEKTLIYVISKTISLTSSVVVYFQSEDWDSIISWEKRNLNLYYITLYTPNAPKPMVDMLLRQKSCIEDYLMEGYRDIIQEKNNIKE